MHRRENFGSAQREILRSFLYTAQEQSLDILFPVHPNPNVRKSVEDVFKAEMGKTVFNAFDMNSNALDELADRKEGRIFLIDPLDYASLVFLMKNCRFVMTDSGGIQEEAPTFKKKIIVLRESTERPEGVEAGFSILAGTRYENIIRYVQELISHSSADLKNRENPFGDGRASMRIIEAILKH
jgi:UDP-N-acetylglucosamine 2-epimerase (non-hydrolysing)